METKEVEKEKYVDDNSDSHYHRLVNAIIRNRKSLSDKAIEVMLYDLSLMNRIEGKINGIGYIGNSFPEEKLKQLIKKYFTD